MSNRTELPKVDAEPGGLGHWVITDDGRYGRRPTPDEMTEIARRCNVHDELCEALEVFSKGEGLPPGKTIERILAKARGET